jgi:exopolysaccharide biosynthesis polyprenyl glycosylphosphotransferase
MIRRHLMALRVALMIGDGVVAFLVFMGVSIFRFGVGDPSYLWLVIGIDHRAAAVLYAVTWVVVLWATGLYRIEVRWRLWTEMRDLLRATILMVAITLSALFLLKQVDVSRLFLVLLFLTQLVVTLGSRVVLRSAFEEARRRGHDPRYMLVAGTGTLAQSFADRVERHPGLGIRIVGHLSTPSGEVSVTRPVLGSVEQIEEILHDHVVDEVAVCLPPDALHLVEPIAGVAAGVGKTVRIPVDPVDEMPGATEEFDGFLVRSLAHDGQREVGLVIKRAIDVAGALVGLILLSPLLIGAALAIRLSDGAPVIFGQTRVGLHGRPFTIYKFRSMVRDAEARLEEVRHLNERDQIAFKASDDPRITGVGRFLRRTSIDELPQLWNVLTGSMSLVGPRPPLPAEVAEYDVWHRRRLSMKPGITGLWQVEARNDPDFDRWVEHDLVYIDGWSIWLDLKILLKTIPALVAHGGR